MTELTPNAEALREKLANGMHTEWWPKMGSADSCATCKTRAIFVARIIVEQLGITEDAIIDLRHVAQTLLDDGRISAAEILYQNANREATLLELANHGE